MLDVELNDEVWRKVMKLPPSRRDKVVKELGRMEWQRCADDVFYWIDPARHWVPYAFTKDEHPLWECKLCGIADAGHAFNKLKIHLSETHGIEEDEFHKVQAHFSQMNPIRMFPFYEYMRPIIQVWLTEQLILVPKSRDMMATWMFVSLFTWDTIFHKARQNFFQAENAAKTRDLVKRANIIWKNQPKFLRDIAKASYAIGPFNAGTLTLDDLDSEIIGLPEGAGQVRQFHPSGMLTDETAFMRDAGETFAAVKPAIQAGGRYTAVSTAYPSWFELAVKDTLEMDV